MLRILLDRRSLILDRILLVFRGHPDILRRGNERSLHISPSNSGYNVVCFCATLPMIIFESIDRGSTLFTQNITFPPSWNRDPNCSFPPTDTANVPVAGL